jgi:hypothetical protein
MSESKLLIIAGFSMIAMSLLVSGILIWANVEPLWVMASGTTVGIGVYAGFWLIRDRYIRDDFVAEEGENA